MPAANDVNLEASRQVLVFPPSIRVWCTMPHVFAVLGKTCAQHVHLRLELYRTLLTFWIGIHLAVTQLPWHYKLATLVVVDTQMDKLGAGQHCSMMPWCTHPGKCCN